ncbi:MAG: Ig-like domain-containing protein, partial [Anaerolineales bacterium]|nr:Ig-like domain-containing protein [Anaerolineales bacterium]
VHVTVDNEPPIGELVFPQEGQIFSGGRTEEVAIQVDAQDSFGIERVVFFIDGEEVATVSEEPFSIRWQMGTLGSHEVYADVFDLAGNKASTEPIEFTINKQ